MRPYGLTRGGQDPKSINISLQKQFQSSHSSLCIRAGSNQIDHGTGNDSQRHNAQKTLGIHLAVGRFQPNTAFKLVGFLNKVCSLLIILAGLTADDDFLIDHVNTPSWTFGVLLEVVSVIS